MSTLVPRNWEVWPVLRSAALIWREARPVVQLMYLLRFLVGASVSIAGVAHLDGAIVRAIVLGGAASFGVSMYVYVLNGLTDVAGDRANGSRRPLASGELTSRTARGWLWFLAIASLGLAFAVNPVVGLISTTDLVLGTAYSWGRFAGKRNAAAATAIIGIGGALSYLVGGAAVFGLELPLRAVVVAVAMGLWMAAAGNTKDFDDVVGDAASGRRTLSVMLGVGRASAVVGAAVLVVGALGAALALGAGPATAPRPIALGLLAPFALVIAGFCFGPARLKGHAYTWFMISQLTTNFALVVLTVLAV